MSVVTMWKSDVYHVLPMCYVSLQIEVRIKFSALKCLLLDFKIYSRLRDSTSANSPVLPDPTSDHQSDSTTKISIRFSQTRCADYKTLKQSQMAVMSYSL